MRRVLGRSLLMVALGLVTLFTTTTVAAADSGKSAELFAEFGISYVPQGETHSSSQCVGPRQQWAPVPSWSSTILLDTDQRPGGCQLSFGIRDFNGGLAGLNLTYAWSGMADDAGQLDGSQCGNQGQNVIPITQFPAFGPNIFVDTDARKGGCLLTFAMSGRTDIALDVQFTASNDEGRNQCAFTTPPGQWRTVAPGSPVSVGIDTDQRLGGCELSLRLRQL